MPVSSGCTSTHLYSRLACVFQLAGHRSTDLVYDSKLTKSSVFLHFRVWSIANFLGPIVGGALANNGTWRWLFCKPIIAHLLPAQALTSDRPQSTYLGTGCRSRYRLLEVEDASW